MARRRVAKLTGILLIRLEKLDDLVANLAIGHLDVVLGFAVLTHEGEEVVVGDVKLE